MTSELWNMESSNAQEKHDMSRRWQAKVWELCKQVRWETTYLNAKDTFSTTNNLKILAKTLKSLSKS